MCWSHDSNIVAIWIEISFRRTYCLKNVGLMDFFKKHFFFVSSICVTCACACIEEHCVWRNQIYLRLIETFVFLAVCESVRAAKWKDNGTTFTTNFTVYYDTVPTFADIQTDRLYDSQHWLWWGLSKCIRWRCVSWRFYHLIDVSCWINAEYSSISYIFFFFEKNRFYFETVELQRKIRHS